MNELRQLRNQIDRIDKELIQHLAERSEIVKQIGEYKRKVGQQPLNTKRWRETEILRSHISQKEKVDPNLVKEVYEVIHKFSLKQQE